MERQLGRKPKLRDKTTGEEYVEAYLPEPLAYLWRWFQQMAARRTGNGMGPNPLTPSDVECWARLHRITLTPWEAALVFRLDDSMLAQLRGAK